jgi:NAD(P)-dependent dehydrogenase (short-subunit alcohol dehydrogenase family)
MKTDTEDRPTVLLVGASRGLGYAMAAEFLNRGWNVIGTVRSPAGTRLHELAAHSPGRIRVEILDMTMPEQIGALRSRLDGTTLNMLFVNAGVTNNPNETIGEVSTAEFIRVMVTNALSPMRVVEVLHDLVIGAGTLGIMSSGQGSIANNNSGMREVYRGSKAALNMLMRSFAARECTPRRSMALIAPGWVRTELGGPDARLTIAESVPGVVNTLLAIQGNPGLQYLDYLGRTVPW